MEFYSEKLKNRFLSHPLGDLGVTYALHLGCWKARGRFICCNWMFSLSLTVETLFAEICRSRRFSKVVGHFWQIFRMERDNSQWSGKTRLEISLFRMVLRYWQAIILFCHNGRT